MDRVELSIGSGGKKMGEFIEMLSSYLGFEPIYDSFFNEDIGFTTDSYVVSPIFFPGGDIGKLSICGTYNDLVVCGILPKYISLSLIIEEGFPMDELKKILLSIKETSDACNIQIVTGDTKVVRKGEVQGLFINTGGIGRIIKKPSISLKNGDKIIITGPCGDHSASIMMARGEFEFEGEVKSDCSPMKFLLQLWEEGAIWMRDITRGGLATVLCELSRDSNCPLIVDEGLIPLSDAVLAICSFLGLDPLYLASEGCAIIVTDKEKEGKILEALHKEGCHKASTIGEIGGCGRKKDAILKTKSGGLRLLSPLTGELLPRIC